MGDGNKQELEGIVTKLAKAPFRFIKSNWVPAAIGLGIGSAYMGYQVCANPGENTLDRLLESFKDAVSSPGTWTGIAAGFAVFVGGLYGALAVRNVLRKKKGKKPVDILKLTKQILFPSRIPKGEKGLNEVIDSLPDSSLAYNNLGSLYFKEGRIIEGMEAYYRSMQLADAETFPKVPFIGTSSYVETVAGKIPALEQKLGKEPGSSRIMIEIAMRYLILNDAERAAAYFKRAEMEQDPIAFHTLASRFYSEAAKRAGKPKLRKFSFGSSRIGRIADRVLYFWSASGLSREDLAERADNEAVSAVRQIFQLKDAEKYLEQIGDYNVYRISLNSFVRGFIVAKTGDSRKMLPETAHEKLAREKENELLFQQRVAGGRFRSVHPIDIVQHNGNYYLILLHENGRSLSYSTNTADFRSAMQFAARSDALMPLDHVENRSYNPFAHFEARLAGSRLPSDVAGLILENSTFLFKQSYAFPAVFDGDWHPANCLVDEEGIIALDKEDKGVTIGPVSAARLMNQGTVFGSDDESKNDRLKDDMITSDYIATYQQLADSGNRIYSTEVFIPAAIAATIEKAITSYCFTVNCPQRQQSTRIFLHRALHAGARIRDDRKIRRFFSDREREQCSQLQRVIYNNLIPSTAP